jgi:plasmid stabilization system protein ParE
LFRCQSLETYPLLNSRQRSFSRLSLNDLLAGAPLMLAKAEPETLSLFVSFCCAGRSRRRMMARGDKDAYTNKQKRKAEHIEKGYEKRGVSKDEAEGRAWATVNKDSGGGNKSGSGRGSKDSHDSARAGGRRSSSSRSTADRSAAAKKGWETRRKRAAH